MGNQLHTYVAAKRFLDPDNQLTFNLDRAGLPLQLAQLGSSIFHLGPVNVRAISTRLNLIQRNFVSDSYKFDTEPFARDGKFFIRGRVPQKPPSMDQFDEIVFSGFFGGWGSVMTKPENVQKLFSRDFQVSNEAIDSETIAIHLRLGDYMKLSGTYGVLTAEYFMSAIDSLASTGRGFKKILLYSDSPRLAKAFASKFEIRFRVPVHVSSGGALASELLLKMISASYFVGSNSSLSWWAAFLRGEEKTSILPWPWFRAISQPDEFIPPWVISQTSDFLDT